MDKLYSLYHQSPKNQNELRQEELYLFIGLHQVNGLYIINNCSALYKHFKFASTDVTRDLKERSKYNGLKLMISSVEYVSNLNAMADTLDELGELSEYLQSCIITLVEVDKAIRTTIRVFDSMVNKPGHKLYGALQAIELNIYKNVPNQNGQAK
ncbi:Hypothetical protein CINCED_3A022832 [Cinara cedri]|uniref:Uncharacterized protein n=1 Tax=Cinara cedri TaxID=506608 RepID=A0A5E4MLN2_9HEMI|nr:Hypothetical protein CINCED_3A022832 [Cinara cedri]